MIDTQEEVGIQRVDRLEMLQHRRAQIDPAVPVQLRASAPCCWGLKISCAAWDTASRSGFLAAVSTAAVCASTACAVSPGGAVFSASFTCLAACAVESASAARPQRPRPSALSWQPLARRRWRPPSPASPPQTSASRRALRTGLASAFCSGEGISQGGVGVSPTCCSGAALTGADVLSALSFARFVLSGLSLPDFRGLTGRLICALFACQAWVADPFPVHCSSGKENQPPAAAYKADSQGIQLLQQPLRRLEALRHADGQRVLAAFELQREPARIARLA